MAVMWLTLNLMFHVISMSILNSTNPLLCNIRHMNEQIANIHSNHSLDIPSALFELVSKGSCDKTPELFVSNIGDLIYQTQKAKI